MAQEFKSKNNTNTQENETPQVFSTGGGPAASQGKVSAFSSGLSGANNSQPSGRFTNLQNYLNANKDASASMAERANKNINQSFQQQQQNVNKANEQISKAFEKGSSSVNTGQGFQTNLSDINKNLNEGYTDFGNRDVFNQAAANAGALAKNQDYTNIASGQGFDETATKALQTQALMNAQNLNQNVSQNLQNIQTEQGRNTLFNNVLRPKAGYSENQQSLDKLFLQQGLGNVQKNLQAKQQDAASILSGTAGQQATLEDLTNREADIVKNLSNLAGQAQSTFNEKLYGTDNLQKNINVVNEARQQNYADLINRLKAGGTVTKDEAAMLGLDQVKSFTNPSGDLSSFGTAKSYNPSGISLLNSLKDPTKLNEFLAQGKQAVSAQDITTQEDYDLYKGLEALTGKNAGLLSGASQLGSSVVGVGGKDTKELGGYVNAQNREFEDKIRSGQFDTTATPRFSSNVANISGIEGLDIIKNLTPEQRDFLNSNQELRTSLLNENANQFSNLNPILDNIRTAYTGGRWVDNQGYRRSAAYDALRDIISKYNTSGLNNTLNVTDNPVNPKKFSRLL